MVNEQTTPQLLDRVERAIAPAMTAVQATPTLARLFRNNFTTSNTVPADATTSDLPDDITLSSHEDNTVQTLEQITTQVPAEQTMQGSYNEEQQQDISQHKTKKKQHRNRKQRKSKNSTKRRSHDSSSSSSSSSHHLC
jgi:hypothetical protein